MVGLQNAENFEIGSKMQFSRKWGLQNAVCRIKNPPSPEITGIMTSASTSTQITVLPGDRIPPSLLPIPRSPSGTLKLGPGLVHVPPSNVAPSLAGMVHVDAKKSAIWIENNDGRVYQSLIRQFSQRATC